MLHDLNERFVRLAFPLRSSALDTLVDTNEERRALRALRNLTARTTDDVRAYIERPFAYPTFSRFSNGSYGVLYAANSPATALRETAYHLERIYADGKAPPMETRRTQLTVRVNGRALDIRRALDPSASPALYDPDSYGAAQQFGERARTQAEAIHYDSVRNTHGGRCVGAFTPVIVRGTRIIGQTALVWDGKRFIEEHVIKPL